MADSQMESSPRFENIFAVATAQAAIWAAWVRLAQAPGTKAVMASRMQAKRINTAWPLPPVDGGDEPKLTAGGRDGRYTAVQVGGPKLMRGEFPDW